MSEKRTDPAILVLTKEDRLLLSLKIERKYLYLLPGRTKQLIALTYSSLHTKIDVSHRESFQYAIGWMLGTVINRTFRFLPYTWVVSNHQLANAFRDFALENYHDGPRTHMMRTSFANLFYALSRR